MGSKIFLERQLLIGSLLLGAASPLFAQDKPDSGKGLSRGHLEEVVVTARRREESLQTVPVTVTALTGNQMSSRKLTSINDLVQAVPSMQVASNQGKDNVSVTLRGIGLANQYNANAASPVGVYFDDVYQTFRPAPGVQQFDLERVEVLRGPQGTLFGRNTTGGAINYITVKPSVDGENENYVTVGVGNYSRILTEAAAGATLVPGKLGVRAAVQYTKADGYMKNRGPFDDGGEEDALSGRVLIRATPTEAVDATLKLYSNRNDGTVPTGLAYGVLPGETNLAGYSRSGLDDDEAEVNFDGPSETKARGVGFNLSIDMGSLTLISITQYDKGEHYLQFDCDASPITLCQSRYEIEGEQINQDLRITYGSEAWDWVIGAYYGWDEIDYDSNVGFGGATFLRNRYIQTRTSSALYGEATYKLGNGLSLTAGLRYTDDKNELDELQTAILSSFAGAPLFTTIPSSATYDPNNFFPKITEKSDDVTGRIILQYELSDQSMIYGSISNGYRSGSFNGSQFFSISEINYVPPEEITTYELGIKSQPVDGVLLNAAVYFNDIEGQQVITSPVISGIVQPNLGSVDGESYGLEIEAIWQVNEALRISGNLGLIESEYDKNQTVDGRSIDGNDFPFAPDITGLAALDWTIWSSGEAEVVLSGSANYMGSYFYDPTNGDSYSGSTIVDGSDSYWLFDARIAYSNADFTVSLWGKNLEDKFYIPFNSGASEGLGFDYASRGMPRTYGIEATMRF